MSLSSEAHGTSSYSTSPTSSVENVSTVETGELSVFTFIIPQQSGPSSPASSLHSPCSSHRSPCFSPESTPYILHPSFCSCDIGPFLRESSTSDPLPGFTMDPLRLDDPQTFHSKYHHHHSSRKFIEQQQVTRCLCHSHSHHQPFHHISHALSDNNYIRHLPRAGDGILLRSLERGVLFPVIHWSTKSSENLTHPTSQFSPTLPSNQGIYKEIKRVIPADIWLQREVDPNLTLSRSISSLNGSSTSLSSSNSRRPTTWLIIGYKSLEKTLDSSLEATWKEWTGIRHVYLHLRSDFEIRKISFMHRVHPIDNLDLFMYIVMMEIGNVEDKNRIWLLDFVQRMRVERMKGFLTVYSQVEQDISSVGEEYRKYAVERQTPLLSPPPLPPKLRNSSLESESVTKSALGLLNGKPTTPSPTTTSVSISTALLDYHTSEINCNIKFMENLLEEIHQQPITGDYF